MVENVEKGLKKFKRRCESVLTVYIFSSTTFDFWGFLGPNGPNDSCGRGNRNSQLKSAVEAQMISRRDAEEKIGHIQKQGKANIGTNMCVAM